MRPLIKLGELTNISADAIRSADSVLSNPSIAAMMSDEAIMERFKKVAADLKAIAPKAKDFLYFSAIMMHAAEASLLDDNGKIKKDARGNDVTINWEKKGESWKWVCSDPYVKAYKNSNSDIFPEEELIKAHKKWVGRPLCLDHQSSSVDMIRGVIVDTYYDYANKRVVALCALDKVNYPDLARKVSSGYAASVSMGTAVGKAICSDCGRVARTEAEYCDCMRSRRCYGEINIDLNPMELSIVVNGADPKAKIRHIVAAAESIARYVESKEQLVNKISSLGDVNVSEISALKDDLTKVLDRVVELEKAVEQAEKDKESCQEMPEDEKKEEKSEENLIDMANNDITNEEIKKLAGALVGIKENLGILNSNVSKLLNNNNEDIEMSIKQGYFQGGGGPNEPSPGQPKYEKENYQAVRDGQDKQMVGQMDTGPVDGLHPGPDSVPESEIERKKKLLRAERRQEALVKAKEAIESGKKAYFQGGGGPNEPTPGKPKYEKENYTTTRDKEDKQMVGKKPFPDVGDVEGLYGDDLKEKTKLLRAKKLTAEFVKAANLDGTDNKAESCWNILADNKLIMSGTVKAITKGNVAGQYDKVATKEFGSALIKTIRSEGPDRVAALLKGAQPAPAAPPAELPPAPDAGMPPADMPMDTEAPVAEDLGGTGDPKEQLLELVDELGNLAADMREGIEALTEESGDELEGFEDLGTEEAASGAMGEAPQALATMIAMQKKLGSSLLVGMQKTSEEVNEYLGEMNMAKFAYENEKAAGVSKESLDALTSSLVSDVKECMSGCYELLGAFVKYAYGTQNLIKNAKEYKAMKKSAQVDTGDTSKALNRPLPKHQMGEVYMPANPAAEQPHMQGKDLSMPFEYEETVGGPSLKVDDCAMDDDADKDDIVKMPEREPVESEFTKALQGKLTDEEVAKSKALYDTNDAKTTVTDDTTGKSMTIDPSTGQKLSAPKFDMTTKQGRAEFRDHMTALAQKGLKYNKILDEAHPKGGFTTQLDVKPSDDLAKVETLEEAHDKDLAVALAPPKVKKAALEIQKHVLAGEIDPSKDFPGLVAQGLDPAAVTYWKSLYGQGDSDSKEFASDLTRQVVERKMAAELEARTVKIARAYELAYEMVDRGMVSRDREAISGQVKEILAFNDDGFKTFSNWVQRQAVVKTASSLPRVGMGEGALSDSILMATGSDTDFASDLNGLWSGRK